MQGEIYIQFKRFCKKKERTATLIRVILLFMLSHLILFSVSLERQSNDYQISMNPEKKKAREEAVLPNSIYSHDYATYGPEL